MSESRRLSPDDDPERSPTVRALAHAGTHEELILGSRAYCREAAREYGFDVEFSLVDWEVSTRAKRRAAAVKRPKIPETEVGEPVDWRAAADRVGSSPADLRQCTLSLTWAAFESFDVGEWTTTLRHELIHVEQFQRYGTTDHGPAFEDRADAVDASVKCPPFADPKYVLTCADCGAVVGRRYQECKLVRQHDRYRSSCCGASVACSGPDDG
ncbi:SprT-like domain-containing protein [Halorussus sp. AFM4]|uniref:SprT-like domain-containing protein n=1 Tax=Halorussus sp. AFM4 TaxID=3421651 RepID=UPI003EB78378